MGSTKVFLFSTAIFLAFATYRVWKNRTRRGLRLPPGPKGLPLLGNIFDIDPARPWVVYTEWGKRYGGIVYTSLLGQGFLIINDEKIAQELLERRSSIYSDRPYFSMVDAFGMGFNTGSLSCGKRWRLHRKMFHATFNKQVSMAYKPMQMQKIRQYLLNLISAPEGYTTHSETLSGSIIMAITYGYDAAPKDDPFVSKSIHLLETALNSMPPEYAALLTTFPFLTYIPSWLPGGRHKLEMEKCCKLARTVLDDPVNYVKRNMVTGSAKKSLVLDLIENKSIAGIDEDHDEVMKEVAASVFIAGSDTTLSAILVFFLAMTLYPEVQTKAQEEIDRVIGQDRLPDFSDRENLPYIGAIVLETLRWYPILPLALPHATSTDDVFDGMYIPKGVMVFMNLYAMTQDEVRYPEPEIFKPERHLNADGSLAENTLPPMFSLGRRYCPGKYIADQTLWGVIVSVLSTLRIRKAKDEFGHEIDVKPEFTTGLIPRPKPFPCSIEARTAKVEKLVCESSASQW